MPHSESHSDFLAWTRSAKRRPVVLFTFDVTDEEDRARVLRIATRRYTTATNVYRGRLVDFELDWETEPGVAGYSEPQLAELEIVNDNRLAMLNWGELDGASVVATRKMVSLYQGR